MDGLHKTENSFQAQITRLYASGFPEHIMHKTAQKYLKQWVRQRNLGKMGLGQKKWKLLWFRISTVYDMVWRMLQGVSGLESFFPLPISLVSCVIWCKEGCPARSLTDIATLSMLRLLSRARQELCTHCHYHVTRLYRPTRKMHQCSSDGTPEFAQNPPSCTYHLTLRDPQR